MDDYGGGDGNEIKNCMNEFLEKYNGQYELIHKGYQLAIKNVNCFSILHIYKTDFKVVNFSLNLLFDSFFTYFYVLQYAELNIF